VPVLSSLQVRQLAGDIIPAVPTATTLVAAYAVQELLKVTEERIVSRRLPFRRPRPQRGGLLGRKIFQRGKKAAAPEARVTVGEGTESQSHSERERLLERFRNIYFCLRQPEVIAVRPVPAPVIESTTGRAFTLWDAFVASAADEVTIADVNSLLSLHFNASLSSLSAPDSGLLLYDRTLASQWFPGISASELTIEMCHSSALRRRQEGEEQQSPSVQHMAEELELEMEAVRDQGQGPEAEGGSWALPPTLRLGLCREGAV
jgi:hypothetical protein